MKRVRTVDGSESGDSGLGPLVVAVDQGTGSTKALLVDERGRVVASGSAPVDLFTPSPGQVEQAPEELWSSLLGAVDVCLRDTDPDRVVAMALTNQRESLVLWERESGRPVGPLLSWQDQRTVGDRVWLAGQGYSDIVRQKSGLPLDPMFSALKAKWLLDTYDPDRSHSRAGDLCLGTVDSWLLSRLSGGQHLIEAGNASRTQLMNVATRTWDDELLTIFGVPRATLPDIRPSGGIFCHTDALTSIRHPIPVAAVMGDSHAALFAQQGWVPGRVKATYGSGGSLMTITPTAERVPNSLTLTLAWETDAPVWAFEGTIRSVGSTLVWLANLLGTSPDELAGMAANHSDNVYLVPAFNGIAAPWWDDAAAALICGIRASTGRAQLARAALEAICHQVEDVVVALEQATNVPVNTLLVDGRPTSNRGLMQLQADISGRHIERSGEPNLSALGAAHLAGVTIGLWQHDALKHLAIDTTVFQPHTSEARRSAQRAGWNAAVSRALGSWAASAGASVDERSVPQT